MNDNTINTEVTMRDDVPAGGAKRFCPGDEILGRYVVESELGQGGMGVVYLCLDKVGGVKVAVKGLPPEVSHNSDEMESVRENFQLVSELQHPNIAGVRTLEKDEKTGDYYLVMAYARGVSLKHWLRQHGGKEHRGEQLKVLRQIASALDYAHNAEPRHIIHRDIKPENVMVDEHGKVFVLDFGLAAQVRSSLSRVSQVVTSRSGTPAYKSPEQWLAQAQRAASDQYSLGVIAYQMFAGELPFDSDDLDILKHAVAFDPVPRISSESKAANAVFTKVLAKKPQDRFQNCIAFVDALEGKGRRAEASGGKGSIVAVGVLLALAAAGGWFWWETVKDEERAAVRMQRLENAKREAKLRKAELVRIAAEKAEAERKAKVEAERLAEEKRKAEKAEAERKAKEEAERRSREDAAADAKRRRKEETCKAIALFKKGEWQAGLQQAQKADQADAELQFWLGTCYDMGLGANCDSRKAVECFRRAAEAGQIDAQCELGRRYESGRGVAKDLSLAKRWYQAAAGQGSNVAERSLRRLYGQESSSLQGTSSAQRRNEREVAARKAHDDVQLQELKDEVSKLKSMMRSNREESARTAVQSSGTRSAPTSDRTRRKFDGAATMSLLRFPSSLVRNYYEKACELARDGAHNKAKVRTEYDKGRTCGGPEWPELEAWLEWWE